MERDLRKSFMQATQVCQYICLFCIKSSCVYLAWQFCHARQPFAFSLRYDRYFAIGITVFTVRTRCSQLAGAILQPVVAITEPSLKIAFACLPAPFLARRADEKVRPSHSSCSHRIVFSMSHTAESRKRPTRQADMMSLIFAATAGHMYSDRKFCSCGAIIPRYN